MLYHINVNFYKIPKGKNFNQINFEELQFNKNSMILLSYNCYLNICKNNFYFNKSKNSYNEFLLQTDQLFLSPIISLKKIYSTNWCLIEEFKSKDIHYQFCGEFVKNIIFVYYEDELKEKEINAFLFLTNKYENPIKFITKDIVAFQNSMFLLSQSCYSNLKKHVQTTSLYKGVERLSSKDSSVNVTLNSLADNTLYFIEDIKFPKFSKTLKINDFPNNIYFII